MAMEHQQSMQEQYLADIRGIIEDNIGNESFSVADLAREVGLSRSMLHRKLIRLIGKSATDLITEIRLSKAYELLENNAGTVSEIAYRVGYSSPSYFNKVFEKTYKVSAGDVRRKGSGKVSHLRIIKEPGPSDSGRSKRSRSSVIAGTNILMIVIVIIGAVALILGLMDNVSPFSGLPEWINDLVLLALIAGLIMAIVLYWIYDIQQKGVFRTKSIDGTVELERASTGSKRRLRLSDVLIVVLILLVGILAYPRIFGSETLDSMADPVKLVNEFGEKETRWVFKENRVTRLVLFPFENETTDTLLDWMGWGIREAVFEDQRQFPNMLVQRSGSSQFKEQIAFAQNGKYPYFLTGTYRVDGPVYEITVRLHQASNGAVLNTQVLLGSDFFSLLDSICSQIRRDLGIPEIILETTPDLPITTLITNHLGAYEHYIRGKYFSQFHGGALYHAYQRLSKAIQLDSTFALAYYCLGFYCFVYQASHISADTSINQAIRHPDKMSDISDIETRILLYMIRGDPESIIDVSEYAIKLRPWDFNLLTYLHIRYLIFGLTDQAEELAVKLNDLVPDHPPNQLLLAKTYLISGKPNKARKVLKKLLADNPGHVDAMLLLGRAFLHDNKLEAAEDAFKKAIFLEPQHEERFSQFLSHISFIRNTENMEKVLDLHTNTSRYERGELSQQIFRMQNQLYVKFQNQPGFSVYPVSDSVMFSASEDDFIKVSTIFSRQGKPVRTYTRQASLSHIPSLRVFFWWIEDSLILRAKDLLAEGLPQDALTAFVKAYEENPEHYYLANYIQHLQLITSPEYETLRSVLQAYAGSYEDVKLEIQDDHFYFIDYRGLFFELLPLSEDTFMVPSIFELTIHIVKENNVVSGLKYLYRDGREEFYPRIQKVPLTQLIN